MEDKVTFLDKVFNFVNSFSKEPEKISETKLSPHLDGLDKESDLYAYAQSATELCQDALRVSERKKTLLERIKDIENRMKEVECFHNLSSENTEKIKVLLDKFVNISKEKTDLYNQLASFDQNLTYLENYKEDAEYALEQIQDAEKKQRILRHDIGYLEGEKAELEYEKSRYDKGLGILSKSSLAIVAVFSIVAGVLSYLYIFMNEDVNVHIFIMCVSMIAVVLLVFLLRARAQYEIKLNLKKQKRAVELLNKKNVVMAYYTNFLRYEYKKYRVHNSQTLRKNLKELEHYRHIVKRYDSIRHIMYKIEEEIEMFLRYNNIKNTSVSIEKFSKTINLEDKREYYLELEKEKNNLSDEISELEKRNEDIWDLLLMLNQNDTSEDNVIEKIIQDYFNKLESEVPDEKMLIG